jgi:hypothetical protein
MRRVEIRLDSQPLLLGLQTQQAEFGMRRTSPLIQMERTPPSVQCERTGPTLLIDQAKVWEEMGTGGPMYLTQQQKIQAQAGALEAIGNIAQEGDFLAAIENPGNTIASLAAQLPPEPEFNVGLVPESRPSIRFEGGLKIDWRLGEIKSEFKPGQVETNYQPQAVKAYIRQYDYLKVWTVERSGALLDWQVE